MERTYEMKQKQELQEPLYKNDIRWGRLVISVLIPLTIGSLSALLSANGMKVYGTLNKPPLSPPGWVFSVAWSILYIMMGTAYYLVMETPKNKDDLSREPKWVATVLYSFQLLLNFMWSLIFFRWELRLLAFAWLLALAAMVFLCVWVFMKANRLAGWMMIPYALWLCFAGYLNMGAYLLNR